MKRLYVLYDEECALCRRCRAWLGRQPALIELHFIAMQSPEVGCRFPEIERLGLGKELLVVSDEGAVYRGAGAWIICLYALAEYREWSQRLAHPALLPLARHAFLLLSENRLRFSRWLLRAEAETLKNQIAAADAGACAGGRCG